MVASPSNPTDLKALVGGLICVFLPFGALARCFPATLAVERAIIYQTIEPLVEAGVVTPETSKDLEVCRIEGDWARVSLPPVYYWMRLQDLKMTEEVDRLVRLDLPPNGEALTSEDWCYEAVTISPRTPVFIRDQRDVVVEARVLPRFTPLLACGRKGPWEDVQFEGLPGWAEARHLMVSTAPRDRNLGFGKEVLCRLFYWKAKTTRETKAYRWNEDGSLREWPIPSGVELRISRLNGPWLWVSYDGEWGYVGLEEVEVLPELFEETIIREREEECGGSFVRATAIEGVPVFQSAKSDSVIAVIPKGVAFPVFEGVEDGRRPIKYLGVNGWVEEGGWRPESGDLPLVEKVIPQGFQAETLVAMVEVSEDVPYNFRLGLMAGPVVSSDLPRPGAILDFNVALRLTEPLAMTAGVSGLLSDQVSMVGPDIGISGRLDLSRRSYIDLRVATSLHHIDADQKFLGVGGLAGFVVGIPVSRPYELGFGYTFLAEYKALKPKEGVCWGSNGIFLHSFQISLSLGL